MSANSSSFSRSAPGVLAYSDSISGVTQALFSSLIVWAAFSQKAALRRWRL